MRPIFAFSLALSLSVAGAQLAHAQEDGPAAPQTLTLGQPAPEFKISTWAKGKSVDTVGLGRLYIIDFWAPGHPSTPQNFVTLNRINKVYGDRVTVVGVAMAPDNPKVRKYLDAVASKVDYSIGFDEGEFNTLRGYLAPIQAQGPTTFVINEDARVAFYGEAKDAVRVVKRILSGTYDLNRTKDVWDKSDKLEEALDGFSKLDQVSKLRGQIDEEEDLKKKVALIDQLRNLQTKDNADEVNSLCDGLLLEAYTVGSQWDKALAICDQVEKGSDIARDFKPGPVAADLRRLTIYSKKKDFKKASEVLDRLSTASEDDLEEPTKLFILRKKIELAVEQNDLKRALAACDEIEKLNELETDTAPAPLLAGTERVGLGQRFNDEKVWESGISLVAKTMSSEYGEDSKLYEIMNRLEMFHALSQHEKFGKLATEALDTVQDSTLLNNICWMIVDPESKLKKRDLELALKLITRAIEIGGRQPFMLDTLAWAHFHKGDKKKAIEIEKEAVSLEQSPERKKSYEDTLKKFGG